MFPFRRLAVWHRAHELTLAVHEVTERSYRGRYVSLINQMRRAAASVAANIAEGCGQVTPAQFARYLAIAFGSLRELEYHVLLAKDLGLLPLSDYARLDARVNQVSGMLAKLRIKVLEQTTPSARRIRSDRRSMNSPSTIDHLPSSQRLTPADVRNPIDYRPSAGRGPQGRLR